MHFDFTPAHHAFRQEVRAFLGEKLPPDLKSKVENAVALTRDDIIRWHRILHDQGWIAPNWPKEYGGPGWSIEQRYIFDDELGQYGAPRLISFGLNMCGPVLMRFGTEAQKHRFLPRILSAEDVWCQGYSEPGAGSDLASLKTKAVLEGDHWIVNGSKIWTTSAHMADKVFLLVRTSQEEKKQDGISFLLCDLDQPGVEIRPIHLMDGLHETNQVFYCDVRVPKENLVGEPGKGWTIAKYLLAHERMSGGSLGMQKKVLAQIKAIAGRDQTSGGRPLAADADFRRKLAQAELELKSLEAFILRALSSFSAEKELGAEANIMKLRGSEIHQQLTELRMEAMGYYGQPYMLGALMEGWQNEEPVGWEYANGMTPAYLHYRKVSIYSGSNEIQHNIIAKGTLRL
ncbi:MAG: pimeloyl-CoA dehydrogenase large subunit [Alphaproteobacteria bacterium]|nr:pimeloyl-CoA dehydrogenase large subunit [Alphaproteobacteria bacterium]